MAHSTEIVEYKKLNDENVAFLIRCCGNASTDHWHGMHISVAADATRRKESLDRERQSTADRHELAIKSEEGALDHIGDVQDHP